MKAFFEAVPPTFPESKEPKFPAVDSPTLPDAALQILSEAKFSEAIKVLNGEFCNLPGHRVRINRTAQHFFGHDVELRPTPEMIPEELRNGLVKCRVVYGTGGIGSMEFEPYTFREIKTVAIVRDDAIDYTYKSTDRSRLNELLKASGCDEVIIVKNGFVTDASAANIVLEDDQGALYTPSTPLLRGTKREYLLHSGVIAEREIRPDDLCAAAKIYLINAMIDLEDNVVLPDLTVHCAD